jgi:hypothetical protein
MPAHEGVARWQHMKTRERHRRAHAQLAGQAIGRVTDDLLGVVGLPGRDLRMLVETLARSASSAHI